MFYKKYGSNPIVPQDFYESYEIEDDTINKITYLGSVLTNSVYVSSPDGDANTASKYQP